MKQKLSLIVSSIICLVAVVTMVVALCMKPQTVYEPFTPPPFATNVQTGTPVVDEALGYTTLAHEDMSFSLSLCGKPVINGDTAEVYLTNHAENNVWLKLRVLDESGAILAETGLVKPNEYLKDVLFDTIPADNQTIFLKIMSYEIDTYYSMGAVSLRTTIQHAT